MFIETHDFTNAGSVAFHQSQKIEDCCQVGVPRLGYSQLNGFQGKPSYQSSKGDELHMVVIYIDNDASGEKIVTMDKTVQQCFPDGVLRVIQSIFS